MSELREKLLNELAREEHYWSSTENICGSDVCFKRPTLKERDIIVANAKVNTDDGTQSMWIVWSIIILTYDAKNRQRIFEDTDFDMLMNSPSFFLEQIFNKFNDFLDVNPSTEVIKKN